MWKEIQPLEDKNSVNNCNVKFLSLQLLQNVVVISGNILGPFS